MKPDLRKMITAAHTEYHKVLDDKGQYSRLRHGLNKTAALKKSEESVKNPNVTDADLLNELEVIIAMDPKESSKSKKIFSTVLNDYLAVLGTHVLYEAKKESNWCKNQLNSFDKRKLPTTYEEYMAAEKKLHDIKSGVDALPEYSYALGQLKGTLRNYINPENKAAIEAQIDSANDIERAIIKLRADLNDPKRQDIVVAKEVLEDIYNSMKKEFLEIEGGYDTLANLRASQASLKEKIKIYESFVSRYNPTSDEERELKESYLHNINEFKELEALLNQLGKKAVGFNGSCAELVSFFNSISTKINNYSENYRPEVEAIEDDFARETLLSTFDQFLPFSKKVWFGSAGEVKLTQDYLDKIADELTGKELQQFMDVASDVMAMNRNLTEGYDPKRTIVSQAPLNTNLLHNVDQAIVSPLGLQLITKLPAMLEDIIKNAKELGLDVSKASAALTDIKARLELVNNQNKVVDIPADKTTQQYFGKEFLDRTSRITIYQRFFDQAMDNEQPVLANRHLAKLQTEIALYKKALIEAETSVSNLIYEGKIDEKMRSSLTDTNMKLRGFLFESNKKVRVDNERLAKAVSSVSGEEVTKDLIEHCADVLADIQKLQQEKTIEGMRSTLEGAKKSHDLCKQLAGAYKTQFSPEQSRQIEKSLSENESKLKLAENSISSREKGSRSSVRVMAEGFGSSLFASKTGARSSEINPRASLVQSRRNTVVVEEDTAAKESTRKFSK